MVAIAGAAAAAIGAGGSILSGMGAQREATKARRAQETAAQKQLDWDRHMWSYEQVQRQPWVQAGQAALTNLGAQAEWTRDNPQYWQARPGVDPNQYRWQAPETIDPRQSRFTAPQVTDPHQYGWDQTPYAFRGPQAVQAGDYRYTPTDTGALGRFAFTPPTVTDDPGYQFRLQQGVSALDASAAARGGLGSGVQQRALARYGQDLGSQEYQAAYGRAWQQQQEQYERSRLMNMTQEERQRYANQAAYERAMQTQGTQWQQAQAENQMGYERGLTRNQLAYDRAVQQQQELFRQGYMVNDVDFQRLVQQNQQQYERGLTANQQDWQRGVYANETEQQRQWQQYAANIAERERNWNQWAQMAGFGQQQMNQLGQLGAGYAQGIGNAYGAMGNAQATGYLNQANARTNMYSGIAGSLAQGGQNYLLSNYTQGLNTRQPTTAAPSWATSTLPTTMAQYNAGGYANAAYAPFG